MEPAATRPVVRVLRRVARLEIVQLGLEYPVVESPWASGRIWRRIWQDHMSLHEGPGCSSTRPYEERRKTSRSTKGLQQIVRRSGLSDQRVPVRTSMPDGRSRVSSVERLLVWRVIPAKTGRNEFWTANRTCNLVFGAKTKEKSQNQNFYCAS